MKEFTSDFQATRLPSRRFKRCGTIVVICAAFTLVALGGCIAAAIVAVMGALGELATAMSRMLLVFTIPVLIALVWLVSNADWLTWFGLVHQLLKLLELLGWR